MPTSWLFIGICFFVGASAAFADSGDREGSQDHPLVKRYEGSVIAGYAHKAFEEYALPLGNVVDGKLSKSSQLEGEVTRLIYIIPKSRSTVEVMRNYETSLKSGGYKELFSATAKEASRLGFLDAYRGNTTMDERQRFVVWKRPRPEGDVHLVLYGFESAGDFVGGGTKMQAEKGQVILLMDVVVNKAIEGNKLVGAKEMADRIMDEGRIALYGIFFDTNKTDLKQESEPTLLEIAQLLKAQPSLNLLVVGHTDNVGTLAANMDLAQRRAQRVVDTLLAKTGIPKSRLTPVGVSFAAPVASNKSEEGRAKNRRVELVEQ